ncbi:MAG: hypothetical protein GXY09_07340 [Bacteroidales bacterium]|nr:hypothetical protein [Bacteroidales bacterium]
MEDFYKLYREFILYYVQKNPEKIVAITKRIEQASDANAELRQLFLEAEKNIDKRVDLCSYMLMNYSGPEGLKKMAGFLALYVDDKGEKARKNAAYSLMNLTAFKLEKEIETIDEIKKDLAINKALEINVHSSNVVENALNDFMNKASLSAKLPKGKDIKAFDHNYSEEELKQLYCQYACEKVKSTERDFVDILMGVSNQKINWIGKPADMYRFIRYFCKEVVPSSSGKTLDDLYEVRKHINGGKMEEVPFKKKEMMRVFLLNGDKPTIHKTKTIYLKDIHDTFKKVTGL